MVKGKPSNEHEQVPSSKKVNLYQSIWRHIPERNALHIDRRENLKSRIMDGDYNYWPSVCQQVENNFKLILMNIYISADPSFCKYDYIIASIDYLR
jgi:hypothetical protein